MISCWAEIYIITSEIKFIKIETELLHVINFSIFSFVNASNRSNFPVDTSYIGCIVRDNVREEVLTKTRILCYTRKNIKWSEYISTNSSVYSFFLTEGRAEF